MTFGGDRASFTAKLKFLTTWSVIRPERETRAISLCCLPGVVEAGRLVRDLQDGCFTDVSDDVLHPRVGNEVKDKRDRVDKRQVFLPAVGTTDESNEPQRLLPARTRTQPRYLAVVDLHGCLVR